jgi:PAS domain S-box-containing protein
MSTSRSAPDSSADQANRATDLPYRAMFEAATDGVLICTLEGCIVEVNPAFCSMHGYTREELAGRQLATLVAPDSPSAGRPVALEQDVRVESVHVRRDGTRFPVETSATTFGYHGVPHRLAFVRDTTARARTSSQRMRELEALYRADGEIYRSLRLDEVLEALVEVAADVLESDKTSLTVWDETHERLVPGAARGFSPESLARMTYAPGEGITGRVAASGEPITVEDTLGDERVAHQVADAEGIRSLMHVPIMVGGEVFGVFGVAYDAPRTLGDAEQRLLLALAQRAGLAIQNARLHAQSEQRWRELEALYRADEEIYGSLRLEDVVEALVDVAADILQPDKLAVGMWDERGERVIVGAARGFSPETANADVPPDEVKLLREHMEQGVVTFEDALTDPRLPPSIRAANAREGIHSSVTAPIRVGGEVFGAFGLSYTRARRFREQEQRLLLALAQRAALAIQNARLYEQAKQAATLMERQRLARELHDAVTQTLFSTALTAEVLPKLWEVNPSEARKSLEELRRLTRGALAEMRTLLVELRPGALVEMPMSDLMRQLAEATAGRTRIEVSSSVTGEPVVALPSDVKLALYRIAQEALNNVVKHAQARRVDLVLRHQGASGAILQIDDDGRGFDPAAIPGGHLGVGIMRERAEAVGAILRVQSSPGRGTRVHVEWRAPDRVTA